MRMRANKGWFANFEITIRGRNLLMEAESPLSVRNWAATKRNPTAESPFFRLTNP
jgi:hypothetical protein